MNASSFPALLDVAVVGAGAVGLATAKALLETRPLRLAVLEARDRVAPHQTGHNSGVIHSGLYYKPGSLKATLCVSGRRALERFCAERGVPYERCGKVVVALAPDEVTRLRALEERGRANGLVGLRRLDRDGLRAIEPHAEGREALHVPETGIVDFAAVARAYADVVRERGGEVRLGVRVLGARPDGNALAVETSAGVVHARALIVCAGLHADRVARACGVEPGVRVVPFRGEYLELAPERRALVRSLIYPVPDPRFPFLGVHLTRTISGAVEAGPNAVLAFARAGYRRTDFSPADALEMATMPALWRLIARHGTRGLIESWRTLHRATFVRAVRRLVPDITPADLRPGGAGVRAMALTPDGQMVDDFHVVERPRMVHVLSAPSPAATASLAIGQHVARLALAHL